MARTNSSSIWGNLSETQKAQLNEIQAGVVENIQKTGNAFRFKSTNANLSNTSAASYEFKRYVNSTAKEYGTARAAKKGDKLTAPPTTVNVDTHREIIEEVTKRDADAFGIGSSLVSIAQRRKANHQSTLVYETDKAFWEEAYRSAVAGDTIGMVGKVVPGYNSAATTTFDDQIETNAIVPLETTENKFVRGVPRMEIAGVLRPGAYSKLKTALNKMYNANFSIREEDLYGINGVALFSEPFLPKKVDGIIMVKGSVAQPLRVDEYDAEKIPLSNDYALELFFDYGTKGLAPDLVYVMIELDATHTKVVKAAALPASGQAADTIYVMSANSSGYDPDDDIDSTNYPAGTMFTYASATTAWTQYNA